MSGTIPMDCKRLDAFQINYARLLHGEVELMFCLAFDRAHNVLLAQFTGMLVSDDIRALDEAVHRFVRQHGNVRGLLDFTDVVHVAVPESFFQSRSRLTQISVNQERVFVAPQEEVLALARRYASQQRDFGNREPAVVRTLAEAYGLLRMETPNFVAVPQEYGLSLHRLGVD